MKWLSYRILRLLGWQFTGKLPDLPKMVIIGAPHTTNWDFFLFLAALKAYRFKANYLAKEGLFWGPFGWFFKALGGIPVGRSKPGGVVRQAADAFDAAEEMVLVIAPEGTRYHAPHWKSGFIKIAQQADVPVVPASVDFETKSLELGPAITYEGDVKDFMDKLRDFYHGKQGRRPDWVGPVVLQEEL